MKSDANAPQLHAVQDAPKPAALLDPNFRKKVFMMCFGAVLVLAAYISYQWFVYSKTHISTDNAYIDTDLFPVNSRIMGYVKDVPVAENDHVKKGDVLLQLDDSDLTVEMSFKKAKLSKAMSDEARAATLVKSRALSPADFESAQANLIAAQADFDGTQLKLKYTRVRSPIDGVVGKKSVEPGQFVQPGQSLFIVVPEGMNWVKANYKETQLEKIKPGASVDIFVDSYPHKSWHGHVAGIFPSSGAKMSLLPPENATGNFTKIVQRIPVKIIIDDDKEKLLRPGMSVQTVIVTE